MTIEGIVFMHFMEGPNDNYRDRSLHTVNNAGLDSCVHFCPGNRCWFRPKGSNELHMGRVIHRSELQSLHILRASNRTHIVGKTAKTPIIPNRDSSQTCFSSQIFIHPLPILTSHNLKCLIYRMKQVRYGNYLYIWVDNGNRSLSMGC